MKRIRCLSEPDMAAMQEHPNERALAIGKRLPYHLQYLREGGLDIKPREEDNPDESNSRVD